jgi:hypothetical protein
MINIKFLVVASGRIMNGKQHCNLPESWAIAQWLGQFKWQQLAHERHLVCHSVSPTWSPPHVYPEGGPSLTSPHGQWHGKLVCLCWRDCWQWMKVCMYVCCKRIWSASSTDIHNPFYPYTRMYVNFKGGCLLRVPRRLLVREGQGEAAPTLVPSASWVRFSGCCL